MSGRLRKRRGARRKGVATSKKTRRKRRKRSRGLEIERCAKRGTRATRRGARSGLRRRHAQVHQAAVQGFALLNHVIFLQKLLQGEALLVEHELRGGRRAVEAGRQIVVSFAPERGAGVRSSGGNGARERAPRRVARRRAPEPTPKRRVDVIATAEPAERLRADASRRRSDRASGRAPNDVGTDARSRGRHGLRRDAPRRETPAPVQATSRT